MSSILTIWKLFFCSETIELLSCFFLKIDNFNWKWFVDSCSLVIDGNWVNLIFFNKEKSIFYPIKRGGGLEIDISSFHLGQIASNVFLIKPLFVEEGCVWYLEIIKPVCNFTNKKHVQIRFLVIMFNSPHTELQWELENSGIVRRLSDPS